MVTFDDLRFSDDKQKFILECHVEDYDVYENVYIESIYIEYYENRNHSTIGVPSNKAYKVYEYVSGDTIRAKRAVITADTILSATEGALDKGLFYVYVTCGGTPSASVGLSPCGFDTMLDVAYVFDWKRLYGIAMQYVSRLANDCYKCDDPKDFEHFILIWNALMYAGQACDWDMLERIWEEITKTVTVSGDTGCGCTRGV